METRVDHLHPRVAQGGGDDLRPAVMAIETGLGDEHTDWTHSTNVGDEQGADAKLAARLAGGQLAPCSLFACHEQHLARAPSERTISPAVVRCLDDETGLGAELSEARWRVEPNAVLTFAAAVGPTPARFDREDTGEWIEAALLRVKGPVRGLPPIAIEEARHHAVAIAPMPDENTAGSQHASELRHHAAIVGRVGEEAEGREEIEHGIEASVPRWWQAAHVSLVVVQRWARASGARARQKLR